MSRIVDPLDIALRKKGKTGEAGPLLRSLAGSFKLIPDRHHSFVKDMVKRYTMAAMEDTSFACTEKQWAYLRSLHDNYCGGVL